MHEVWLIYPPMSFLIDHIDEVILEVQAGAGGQEAGIFAYDVFSMYERLELSFSCVLGIDKFFNLVSQLVYVLSSVTGFNRYHFLQFMHI